MADIELIIKIPEEMYQKIKETSMLISGRRSGKMCEYTLFNAVNNGTPLPKGHGDLIDRDKLLNTLEKLEWIRTNCSVDEDNTNVLEDIIGEMKPIIEAY